MAATDTTRDDLDLIDAVQTDHREIETLFAAVDAAKTEDRRREAFEALVRKLAVHETAEEEVVHPLARKGPYGDAIVDPRLQEEANGKAELAELEKIGVESPEFDAKYEQVRSAVLAHAEHEETAEHPSIRENADPEQLRRAASLFRVAEKTAPTHPHAHAPESATGNVMVGMFVSISDRVRDAIRSAGDDRG